MNTVHIYKNTFPTIGSGSLVAIVANQYPPSDVTIEFEQTSIKWRMEHGGPDEIIMPEYIPMCLCDDIITLIRMGYNLKISQWET
jgi:hypothetical protein